MKRLSLKEILSAVCISSSLLFSTAAFAEPSSNSSDTASSEYKATFVNLNSASKEELMLLKGIGEKKAEAIIEYRNTVGDFKAVEELTEVKGIGAKLLEKNASMLTI